MPRNLNGRNGNAEHVYDDLPIVDEGGYAPSAFESALTATGFRFTRSTR